MKAKYRCNRRILWVFLTNLAHLSSASMDLVLDSNPITGRKLRITNHQDSDAQNSSTATGSKCSATMNKSMDPQNKHAHLLILSQNVRGLGVTCLCTTPCPNIYIIFSYMYIYIFIFIKEDSFIYIYGIDMYVYEYIYHFKQQSTRRLYRTIWDILSMYGNPNSFSVHVQYGYIN